MLNKVFVVFLNLITSRYSITFVVYSLQMVGKSGVILCCL